MVGANPRRGADGQLPDGFDAAVRARTIPGPRQAGAGEREARPSRLHARRAGHRGCGERRGHGKRNAIIPQGAGMLKTGAEHLESLRDGRKVFIGSEAVADVTSHPAFRNAARTVASIYELKDAPENRDAMTFEEDGRRHSAYFLRARTRADLELRTGTHRRIADLTYGMLGRSPDHVASFVTGMAMNPAVFGKYAENIVAYYRHMRDEDVYAAYAVSPPAAARNPEF